MSVSRANISELSSYPIHFRQIVAWGDMDAFAHVNNVMYLRYFESARIAYGDAIGIMDTRASDQIGPIIAASSVRYKRPLFFPDDLIIGVRVLQISTHRFWQQYCLYSTAQACICSEGEAEIVMYNYREQRKAELTEPLRKRIESLEAGVQNKVQHT